MDRAGDQLVQHYSMCDSNGVRTRGWPHGIQWALLQRYGADSMYGAGLMSPNEAQSNTGTGSYVGYSESNSGTDIRMYHPTAVNVHPMPDELRVAWDSGLHTGNINHIHPKWMTLADRHMTVANVSGKFRFGENIGDESGNTGVFQYMADDQMYYIAGGGVLQDGDQIAGIASLATCDASSTPTTITPNTFTSDTEPQLIVKSDLNPVGWPATGGDNVAWRQWVGVFGTHDYPAGAESKFWFWRYYIGAVQIAWWATTALTSFKDTDRGLTGTQFDPTPMQYDVPNTYAGGSTNQLIFRETGASQPYPRAVFWGEYINTDMTAGWSLHQLYEVSGSKASDANQYLTELEASRIATWVASSTHRATELSQEPTGIFWLMHGINDAGASVSKASFKTSTQSIIDNVKAAWVLAGNDVSNLGFVICPGHVADVTKEGYLTQYRDAAAELASSNANTLALRMDALTDAAELAASGMPRWDSSGTDEDHMDENSSDSDNSYSILSLRGLVAIAAAIKNGSLFGRRRRRGIRRPHHHTRL